MDWCGPRRGPSGTCWSMSHLGHSGSECPSSGQEGPRCPPGLFEEALVLISGDPPGSAKVTRAASGSWGRGSPCISQAEGPRLLGWGRGPGQSAPQRARRARPEPSRVRSALEVPRRWAPRTGLARGLEGGVCHALPRASLKGHPSVWIPGHAFWPREAHVPLFVCLHPWLALSRGPSILSLPSISVDLCIPR